MRAWSAVLFLAFAAIWAGCFQTRAGYCRSDGDCAAGLQCNLNWPNKFTCVSRTDGGFDGPDGNAGNAGFGGNSGNGGRGGAGGMAACTERSCSGTTPICDNTTKKCRACARAGDCGGADAGVPVCAPSGACVECTADSECAATKPICDETSNVCRGCTSGTSECTGVSATTPACSSSGTCVQCVGSADCKTPTPVCDTGTNSCVGCLASADCSGTTPICNTTAQTCRACASDSECGGPGVCMTDGHCASASEVVFVDESVSSCPGATGSSTMPYCTLAAGSGALTATQHVLVIRGPMGDRLILATAGILPVVVGQRNVQGVASIPAANGTAIAVSSDTVLVRDLTLAGGTTSGAKGVAITGTGTNVTLLRVTASLGLPPNAGGMGVDAEKGTTLNMNACTVTGNGAGGILLNGAAFDVENTTVTNNGPAQQPIVWGGILVNALPTSGSTLLKFVTIQNNNNTGISCSAGSISGTDVSANGNAGGVDIQGTCGFTSCGAPGATCGAQ